MTVGELIEILKTYSVDMRVIVDGYEGEADDIDEIKDSWILVDANKEPDPPHVPQLVIGGSTPYGAGMDAHQLVDSDEGGEHVVHIKRPEFFAGWE